MSDEREAGQAVVAAARGWIGTPYRHQASLKGVGADCLGLVRGVYEEVTGRAVPRPKPYSADWAERTGAERLIEAARAYCGAMVAPGSEIPGDILIFRWQARARAKHAGILSGEGRFIHAYEEAGVIESPLAPGWSRRIAAIFRIPTRES